MKNLQPIIEQAFEQRQQLTDKNVSHDIYAAVQTIVDALDRGELRVAEKQNDQWIVHQWIKKAILLYFKIEPFKAFDAGYATFYDRLPLKFNNENVSDAGVRIVPSAIARKGAYIASQVVLMPSYVNIGAYVDSGTMVDTWATVGSCAQIGKNVHLSGGVGIGGVLEPLQANPTIIEDNCFIGARSEVVEGVIVEKDSVLSMGVYISQSTPIYNRETKETSYGRIPAGSVVIPGSLPAKDGTYHRYAAIIIKQVDAKTRQKTSLNELLRA
jgi:2,3,4,5-tetrahydropyridine-2-carboxylate N-succinyltransferase